MILEKTTKPDDPTKDKSSSEDLLSILELSELIESIDTTHEDKKNRDGMRDNRGRWIKY